MGASEEVVAAETAAEEEDEVFFVHEDNWPAAVAFCAMSTQWRREQINDGERIFWNWKGLDYTATPMALRIAGIKRSQERETLMKIHLMERAALAVLNDRGGSDG